jgi:uncharacterized protein
MNKNTTLVLGASENPERYSNIAIKRLSAAGHRILALGNKAGNAHGIAIQTGTPAVDDIDTVTLYLNPERQEAYYNYILSLKPRRIIFNPGTENEELEAKAAAQGIHTLEACTLVLLSTGQYETA